MDRDRRLAFLILKEIEENDAWSNLVINKYISENGADSPAFIRELTYGIIRNKLLLDYNINGFLKKPNIGLSERIWLRMGFYQLAFMGGVADYAAINETVNIARSFKKGCEGFINAVLRNFQRSKCELKYPDKSDPSYYSIKYSADKSIVDLWLKYYGREKTEKMLSASNTPAPLTIRVNSLRTDRDSLAEQLSELGFKTSLSDMTPTCITVSGSRLLDTELFKNGYFSVQGEASQYAVCVLDPIPGSAVIDLCAAPGGKTCAMAEIMKNTGSIKAFDLYEHRVRLIDKESKRLGLDIIKASELDASLFDPSLENSADYVLADVPCSGLGTLRQNPEIKYRRLNSIESQRRILENALRYVKPGGVVLYSTCTVNPLENQEITKGYNIEKELQFYTEEKGIDGFYICKIRR